eukprot:Polyplicarium_translucidae@DN2591_c0_g1_i1.p1
MSDAYKPGRRAGCLQQRGEIEEDLSPRAAEVALSSLSGVRCLTVSPCCALSPSSAALKSLLQSMDKLEECRVLARHLAVVPDIHLAAAALSLRELTISFAIPAQSRSRLILSWSALNDATERDAFFPRLERLRSPVLLSEFPPHVNGMPRDGGRLLGHWIAAHEKLKVVEMEVVFTCAPHPDLEETEVDNVDLGQAVERWNDTLSQVSQETKRIRPQLQVCFLRSDEKAMRPLLARNKVACDVPNSGALSQICGGVSQDSSDN